MKLLFLALIIVVLSSWVLWHSSIRRLWRWMEAKPVGHFPVWRQVKERMEVLAKRERVPMPTLWVLPEFSPNALVLRHGRTLHVALAEGLLQALDGPELEAVLLLCLAHGRSKRRRLLSFLSLQLFPFAQFMQKYPALVQIFLSPWITIFSRLVSGPKAVMRCDLRGCEAGNGRAFAAALQKMAVLGRKIPFRRWNLALDPVFLISPLALDGGPYWVFLTQPSVEKRRLHLLAVACESPAGLQ